MGLANGVHHLAICTRDIKQQIEFFTEVVGAELEALYWMHGVKNTFHGFLKLSDSSSVAFVQGPEVSEIQPVKGLSHATSHASPVAPGAVQHIALNVDSEADLLAIRDRVRAHGYWIMGPLDHGFCKSIYMEAPEGIMLEFSTSEGKPIDAEAWIDPEVVKRAGISPAELERYKNPPAFQPQGGNIQNPPFDPTKPRPEFPPGLDAVYTMSDAEVTAKLSESTPPVQVRR
jgi:catechol 2,3-dioxygenase-like lactoylglutathione lyase family enzyme